MRSPAELKHIFKHWEIVKDFINQCIDIMLNLSQSDDTGGSSRIQGSHYGSQTFLPLCLYDSNLRLYL